MRAASILILAVLTILVAVASFFATTLLIGGPGAGPPTLVTDIELKRQLEAIETRVADLIRAGCKPLELSFEAPNLPQHRHPKSKPECKVFGEDVVTYAQLGSALLNAKGAGKQSFGHMLFSSANNIEGLGQQPCALGQNHEHCNDLIVFMPYLTQGACSLLNRLGGLVSNSPAIPRLTTSGTVNMLPFTGSVDGQQTIGGSFSGRKGGCGAVDWMYFPPGVAQAGFVGYRVLVLR